MRVRLVCMAEVGPGLYDEADCVSRTVDGLDDCRERGRRGHKVRVPERQGRFGVLVVLGSGRLINYQHGGGHWAWFLQYPCDLRALGYDVFWIGLTASSEDRGRDQTGWFSDRSIACLASSRPVVAQETGSSERLPTGSRKCLTGMPAACDS